MTEDAAERAKDAARTAGTIVGALSGARLLSGLVPSRLWAQSLVL